MEEIKNIAKQNQEERNRDKDRILTREDMIQIRELILTLDRINKRYEKNDAPEEYDLFDGEMMRITELLPVLENIAMKKLRQKAENITDEDSVCHHIPPDFVNSTEEAKKFSDRLKALFSVRQSNPDEYYPKRAWTQVECANELGVKPMTVNKYVNHKIKSVPLHRLNALKDYFSVTTHYLLSYTDNEINYVLFDKTGNVMRDKSGKIKELSDPMPIEELKWEEACLSCQMLRNSNYELFREIFFLIHSSKKQQQVFLELIKLSKKIIQL